MVHPQKDDNCKRLICDIMLLDWSWWMMMLLDVNEWGW